MTRNKAEINPTEVFTGKLLNREGEPDLFRKSCPHCHGENTKVSRSYETKNNGEREIYTCQDCGTSFSETYGTPIAGLTTPLSEVIKVLKARMEGMGLNAAERVFGFTKKTILSWEKRLSSLQETLFL